MYKPTESRYSEMKYARCGRSGLLFPRISLGLWQNFGGLNPLENSRAMIRRAFDLGITHLDLANNYGPPPGSTEETFGTILRQDLRPWRDELIISTKAGYWMWNGPYGDMGGRRIAGFAGKRRCWRHCLFTACKGHSHQSLTQWHSVGLPRGQFVRIPSSGGSHRCGACKNQQT